MAESPHWQGDIRCWGTDMQKVAFICVHNSCRSQIAEALGRHLAADVFESYSAGTETKPQINQDAVRLMKQLYHIDMEAEGQRSKLLSDLPALDGVSPWAAMCSAPSCPANGGRIGAWRIPPGSRMQHFWKPSG